ncbi:sulfatase-like hydrolase/transferase [uncultured Hydrogenophaga sp.]|uniref:sulfatase-like hydrolase/transferase n=1 Tax=uncultured Hydrogenophaga sp. TaxID=199683 RepID=UPI002582813B|nr:sulfatase-like hydrolase/transferase [uncultured Hydrogenophaga sp.]
MELSLNYAACNSLVIMTDEQDGWAMGCAGHPFVRTPHMDSLAARGTRFSQAFTPSPICVPARAAFATGRWVHEIDYWDNATGYDGRVPGWGHTLQAAGHRVESIGKLHYQNGELPTGFDRQHHALHLAEGLGQVWGSVRDPMPREPRQSRLFHELGPGTSHYNDYDTANADATARWLHERASRPDPCPWTLYVGLVAPHFPLVVPQRFLDAIDIASLPPPRLHPADGFERHPWVQRHADYYDSDAELGTPERRRLALACYYALVGFVDEQIGRILTALAASGLEGTTRVILTSDHGDNQGARGLWNKSTLYREAVQVPLVMAGPDVPVGRVCETAVNLIDIAPTLVQGAGLAVPEDFSGRSLLDIAQAPHDPQRIAFSEYHAVGSPSAAYMVRQERWSYHHYVGFEPELFDVKADPGQTRNLARDKNCAGVLTRLERVLRDTLDPEQTDRRAKADQNRLVERMGGRDVALRIGPQGASPAPKPSDA